MDSRLPEYSDSDDQRGNRDTGEILDDRSDWGQQLEPAPYSPELEETKTFDGRELLKFLAVGLSGVCFLWFCVVPFSFGWFADFDGSDVIGFYANSVYAFINTSILFYLFTCWRQSKGLIVILPLSLYSILFSYGY